MSGYFVEAIGYRVSDPCDGSVVVSDPPASAGEIDRAACERSLQIHAIDPSADKPATGVPMKLSAADVRRAMQVADAGINDCFDSYGVAGTADVYVELGHDGSVKSVDIRGEFADTPTGQCVAATVKNLKFPPFKRESMQIHYPFILR